MKANYKTTIITLTVIFIVLMLPVLASAQFDTFPDGGNPDNAPIDGGLSLLAAAGVGYGAKKLKDRRKKAIVSADKF